MKGDLCYAKYSGEKKCPRCKQPVYGYPALSRVDNYTYICSDCGNEEAMRQFMYYQLSTDYQKNHKET